MVQTVVKGEMRRMGRELLRGALGSLAGRKRWNQTEIGAQSALGKRKQLSY